MYSEKVYAHFIDPQNAYHMLDSDGSAYVGDSSCGDALSFFIKVREQRIVEASYLVYGCAASIATSSMTSVLVTGKTISEAMEMTEADVVDALDGLPAEKQHCSNLGISALKKAINDYFEKHKTMEE